MRTTRNTLIFLCFCLPVFMLAQSAHFDRLDKEDGLPRATIQTVLQDQQGFIWVGTTDGLFRYDGKSNIEFRHNPKDTNSLCGNNIKALFEDSKGNIWIGTRNGLNLYSPDNELITRYINHKTENFSEENYIHSVLEDSKGYVWYGTYKGLFRLNPRDGDLMQFLPQIENPNTLTHHLVWNIFEDKSGRLWFGTGNGLTVYKNDDSFQFEPHFPEPKNPNGLKTERIWEFVQQKNGTIWMGSNHGFYKVIEEESDLKFQHYGHDPNNQNSLSHPFIEDLYVDENDHLWAGTWQGGLNEIIIPEHENDSLQFIHYRHNPNDENSISSEMVKTIFKDKSGTLWAGTSGGLDKLSVSSHKFKKITHVPNLAKSLSENIIKSVLQDSDGDLWIGTRNGLNYISKNDFEKGNFKFKIFKKDPNNPSSISHSNIFDLYEDSNKTLWISTYNGLNFIDLSENKSSPNFYSFHTKNGLPHNFIYGVLEIEKGQYWISTYGQLSKMTFDKNDPSKTSFQNFDMDKERNDALVNATVYKAIQDKFGDYWFGTFNGISKYKNEQGQEYFENYLNEIGDTTSLSNNSISTLFKDSKNRLWVATRSGLNLVIQSSADSRATFRNFGMNEGFSNDVIQTLEEDENGKFWIGTNRGLIHFDPDLAINNKPAVLRIYTKEDGLLGNGIIFRSSFKDSQGNLFFGTANGLNFFKPSELTENESFSNIRFTNLKILNQQIKPSGHKNSILKKSISLTENIVLNHRQNVFTLEFAALDFTNPKKNQYAVQMHGFDENWIHLGNENSKTYMNLPSGEYTFKVKASNNDGIWNENPTELKIKILPAPWLTWWAYSLYALAFCGLIYAFIAYRIQLKTKELESKMAIERARFEEREILRKKNAADFHDELGHRLTKISLFLELAERQLKNGTPIREYLNKIKQHSAGLSSGIRDLIWTLDPKKDSLYQTLIRLQEFGDKLFDFSEIQFKSNGISNDFEKTKIDPDTRKHLLLIFKEGMNNCLKYSEATQAELSVSKKENSISISFKDNGKGFEIKDISKGYGLKNMKERAQKMESELSISSEKKKGTLITLNLISTQIAPIHTN